MTQANNRTGALFLSGAALAVMLGLLLASRAPSALPICRLRDATGFPCPTCGTTTGLLTILNGDPGGIAANPLFVTGTLLVLGLGGLAMVSLVLRRPLPDIPGRAGAWLLGGGLLLAANWMFLVWRLR